jgi:hypothetical protein
MSTTPEQQPNSPEQTGEKYESAAEQIEKLQNSPERGLELSPRDAEAAAERAKVEALESAVSVEAGGAERKKPTDPSPAHRRGPINKKQKEASFKRQMKDVQAELPLASRAFSKLIHNKAIEKTSDVIGSTVARPNAILAGAVTAFILTLSVYVIAKNIGYKLSGFETIAAFLVGWILGNVYDYLRVIITGKK